MARAAPADTAAGGAAPGTGRRERRGGGSWLWLHGLICGALVTMLPAVALVLGALLGPAILAYLLDRQPGRPVARCVALCALAASVAPLRDFWRMGHAMEAAWALAGDPVVLGTAWSAAAAGWMLVEILPLLARAALEASAQLRLARLRAEAEKLDKAWVDPPEG